jgi:hypothetical protein
LKIKGYSVFFHPIPAAEDEHLLFEAAGPDPTEAKCRAQQMPGGDRFISQQGKSNPF